MTQQLPQSNTFKMKNSDKIILDLCGGTGSWSKPYFEAGYDVRNITLPEYDVLTYEPPKNVYGILAAPPCTEFSFAMSTRAKGGRDIEKGLSTVKACIEIIWKVQIKLPTPLAKRTNLKFWALENPFPGLLKNYLGLPPFIFQPYEFGEFYTKSTGIWGNFKFPKKIETPELIKRVIKKSNCGNWEWVKNKKDLNLNWKARTAVTPPGFAKAFFKANQ